MAAARGQPSSYGSRPGSYGNRNNASRNYQLESEEDIRSPDERSRISQVHPEPEGYRSDDDEYYQSSLYELIGTPGAPRSQMPGQLFQGKVSARPHPSTLPCYAHARGEDHDIKTCPYSHDPLVYKNAMRKQLDSMAATLGKTWIQITLDKMEIMPAAAGAKQNPGTPRYADSPVRSMSTHQDRNLGGGRPPTELARLDEEDQADWSPHPEDQEDS